MDKLESLKILYKQKGSCEYPNRIHCNDCFYDGKCSLTFSVKGEGYYENKFNIVKKHYETIIKLEYLEKYL